MSELEGVLRALSFIGLGAVLIGIGLFYQRLLTRAAKRAAGVNSLLRRQQPHPLHRPLRIGQCTIAAKMPSATPSHQTGS